MKTILGGLIIVAMVVSCLIIPDTKIPDAESPDNCLVIGAFNIHFPDGYKEEMVVIGSSTKYQRGVVLHFRNVSRNEDFTVEVNRNGYYYFLGEGGAEYLLKSFEYTRKADWNISVFGELNLQVATAPASLVYLGHGSFVFSNPRKGRREQKLEIEWNRSALMHYLRSDLRGRSSQWLKCNVVENRIELWDEYTGEVIGSCADFQPPLYIDYPGSCFPNYYPW